MGVADCRGYTRGQISLTRCLGIQQKPALLLHTIIFKRCGEKPAEITKTSSWFQTRPLAKFSISRLLSEC